MGLHFIHFEDMIKALSLKKRKKFGQHFLKDESIAEKIVSFADVRQNETVLEIGPGKGILTSILLKQTQKVVAVEIDEGLVRYLKRRFPKVPGLCLVHKDFLKYDLPMFSEKIKVIGNLPYSIGIRIIKNLIKYGEISSKMIFMLQKEVAQRLVASPGSKDYGSLSIFMQLHFNIEILMNISPDSFSPPPKVSSTLVGMKPKKPLFKHFDNPELFHKIVKTAFLHRRKKLKNNLKDLSIENYSMEKISRETGIDLDLRGEMLSIEDYLKLTRSINKLKSDVGFCG